MARMRLSSLINPHPCNAQAEERNWQNIYNMLYNHIDNVLNINVDDETHQVTYDLTNINNLTTNNIDTTTIDVSDYMTVDQIFVNEIYATNIYTTYITAYTMYYQYLVSIYNGGSVYVCPPPCGSGSSGSGSGGSGSGGSAGGTGCCGLQQYYVPPRRLAITITGSGGAFTGSGTISTSANDSGYCATWNGLITLSPSGCGFSSFQVVVRCPTGSTTVGAIEILLAPTSSGGCAIDSGNANPNMAHPTGTTSPLSLSASNAWTLKDYPGIPGGCSCVGTTVTVLVTLV